MNMQVNYAYQQFKHWEETGFSKSETPNSEALIIAMGVLTLQIPKKPYRYAWTYEDLVGFCPDCGTFISKEKDSYICECGQKIDWEVL